MLYLCVVSSLSMFVIGKADYSQESKIFVFPIVHSVVVIAGFVLGGERLTKLRYFILHKWVHVVLS